mgnify:CR=1 FL=1
MQTFKFFLKESAGRGKLTASGAAGEEHVRKYINPHIRLTLTSIIVIILRNLNQIPEVEFGHEKNQQSNSSSPSTYCAIYYSASRRS